MYDLAPQYSLSPEYSLGGYNPDPPEIATLTVGTFTPA